MLFFNLVFGLKTCLGLKTLSPLSVRSSLVNKYECNRCKSVYVGKTFRHLSTRVSKHQGVSYRTSVLLTNSPFSAIKNHTNINHNNYTISPNKFTIIESTQTDFQLIKKKVL